MRLSEGEREGSNVNTELAGEKMGRIVEKELFDLIHQEKKYCSYLGYYNIERDKDTFV